MFKRNKLDPRSIRSFLTKASRRKLQLERLELRQLLASDILDSLQPTEFKFLVGEQSVSLQESGNRIAIATNPGATLVLPESLSFVRDVTAGVKVYEWTQAGQNIPIDSISSIDGVSYTASVFVNTESKSEAVLLNELIVALEPGIAPDAFFSQNTKFSSYRRLDGTSDQFVATVRNAYGSSALQVGLDLEKTQGVAWMSPNFYQTWERFYTPNDPRFIDQWHLNNSGQGGGVVDADSDLPEAWDVNAGGSSNIVISVIDDGVQSPHPDLNVWTNPGEIAGDGIDNDGNGWADDIHGWNFVLNNNNSEPVGTDEHGTAVAGVAAARGDNALGVAGAAYRSQVIAIKMFDGNLVASDANIASALYYAAGRSRDGSGTWRAGDLVNNSWGGGGVSLAINNALLWGTTEGRQGRGATYLFATGNGFSPNVSQPAAQSAFIPGVVAVGATNNRAERSDYSNYGSQVDIVTPSNDTRVGYLAIDTTDRTGADGYANGDYTGTGATGFGGTSSATPLAAGITALVLAQADSLGIDLSPQDVRAYLRNATDFLPSYSQDIVTGKNFEVGYGRLNARTAVEGVGKAEISVVSTREEFETGQGFHFGSLNIGRSVSASFRIRNQGTLPLDLAGLFISGPFVIDTPVSNETLDIGESITITVRFVPTDVGLSTGVLAVFSNDFDESVFLLNLTGFAIPAAISGNVYEDFAGDGLRDPSDNPIVNGTGFAYLDANDSGTFNPGEQTAIIDAGGTYEFLSLSNGTYTVRTVLPGWIGTGPASGSYAVTITSLDDFNIGRDFGFQKNQRLYARVFDDRNASGVMESDEVGVPGQQVHLDLNQNDLLDGSQVVRNNTNPIAIPDLSTITSSIVVSQSLIITKVKVSINLEHTFMGDLAVTLIDPSGTRVSLAQYRGRFSTGYIDTVFDDDATTPISLGAFPFTGSFIPETPLAALNGGSTNGTWTLEVSDDVADDDGILNSWSLEIETQEPFQVTNADGFVGLDLRTGNNRARLEPVGIWDYSVPSNGVHTVVANATSPTNSIFYGIFFNNLPPTSLSLAGNSVEENQPAGTFVGSLSTVDPNRRDTFTYELVNGLGDNSLFSISGTQLVTAEILDFEEAAVRNVWIRTTDSGGLSIERSFAVTVRNANEAPLDLQLSASVLPENVPASFMIGRLTVNDPDAGDAGTHRFRLVSTSTYIDNNLFEIRGNELLSRVTFNFESRSNYVIGVEALDPFGESVQAVMSIQVTDVNEQPTSIQMPARSILESLPIGSTVATFTTIDPDAGDSITYSLVSGTGSGDNNQFFIDGSDVKSLSGFDFESKSTYRIRVRATDDDGLWTESPFLLSVQNENEPPASLTLSSSNINEGLAIGARVGSFTALDPDAASTFVFSLKKNPAYPDNENFTIVGSELRSAKVFRYAERTIYTILAQVTDQGGLSFESPMVINVLNVNDQPSDIGLDRSEIAENQPLDSVVGVFSTVDPDGSDSFVYRLVPGVGAADNNSFVIIDAQLRTTSLLNFEVKSSYSIRVESKDVGGQMVEKTFAIQVQNVNESPTAVNLSNLTVLENTTNGIIGTLSSVDPDANETFTYSLVVGAGSQDNSRFVISGTTLRAVGSFNFETTPQLFVRVQTMDAGGRSFERPVVITVANENESPTNLLLNGVLTENAPVNVGVLTATATDPDANDRLEYSFVSGLGADDNGKFSISPSGSISPISLVDFELQSTYNIRIRVADIRGLAIERSFMINVVNQNEAPTDLQLSETTIFENLGANAVVGQLSAEDQDALDSYMFSLVPGSGDTDNARFKITGNSLSAIDSFDFETRSSYSMRVRATDIGGMFYEKVVVVSVKNVNEQPFAVNLSSSSLLENAAGQTLIGDFTTFDPDSLESFTYTLVTGTGSADNDLFIINGSQLRSLAPFDFESKASLNVRIRSQDRGGLFVEAPLIITVRDLNDLPTGLQLSETSVNENSPREALIGSFNAFDQDAGDVTTFRFVAGSNDNAQFTIRGRDLLINANLNFEAREVYEVMVQAVDLSGEGPTRTFSISVLDVNEPPIDVVLAQSSVDENSPIDTLVTRLTASDPDAGDSSSFQLVAGSGSSDNNKFIVIGNELRLTSVPDFEALANFSVRIRTTDRLGLSFEKSLVISVNDMNEKPISIQLSSTSLSENLPSGTVIGALSTSDPDQGDAFTYEILAGTTQLPLAIVGNQLQTTRKLNFESIASYNLLLRSTDRAGLSVESPMVISVLDVNEQAIIAGNDAVVTPTNRSIIIDVLANDSDPDGSIDRSTISIVTHPVKGSVRILADGRIEYTPPADERLTESFAYRVLDNDEVESNTANVAVKVFPAYQNPRNRFDVDNDGRVTPLDVLAIINDIAFNNLRDLPTNVVETVPYIDTNGNSKVDPLDALDVINYINLGSSGGSEGERERSARISSAGQISSAMSDIRPELALAFDAFYRELEWKKNRQR